MNGLSEAEDFGACMLDNRTDAVHLGAVFPMPLSSPNLGYDQVYNDYLRY